MEKGVPFMTEIARRAIKDAGLQPSDISKMTIATSTGVVGYGVDTAIMQALGLRRSLDRTSIGQMGCAAGIIGLRNSMEFVKVRFQSDFSVLPCLGSDQRMGPVAWEGNCSRFMLNAHARTFQHTEYPTYQTNESLPTDCRQTLVSTRSSSRWSYRPCTSP